MTRMVRPVVASVIAWIFGAVAAVTVGMVALSLIGDGLSTRGTAPLVADGAVPGDQVPGAGDPTPGAAATVGPSGAASFGSPTPRPDGAGPDPAGDDVVLHSVGGFVVARCADGRAYLVSWTPEQGYEAHDVRRGPAARASVAFRSDRTRIVFSVSCAGQTPQGRSESDDGGHGSDD